MGDETPDELDSIENLVFLRNIKTDLKGILRTVDKEIRTHQNSQHKPDESHLLAQLESRLKESLEQYRLAPNDYKLESSFRTGVEQLSGKNFAIAYPYWRAYLEIKDNPSK